MRGSGRFGEARLRGRRRARVSIPFIAGQWSLLATRRRSSPVFASFNPLHCGAVVASFGERPIPPGSPTCFNPLHCGAVVASQLDETYLRHLVWFQSPSLRGSGRFPGIPSGRPSHDRSFQSPSLRGSGRFGPRRRRPARRRAQFQSPSLRGSGRFMRRRGVSFGRSFPFQSPSLRGSGRFVRVHPGPSGGDSVSIPFIAGQWSLPGCAADASMDGRRCLNPLHCGAVVASPGRSAGRGGAVAPGLNPLHCGAVVASNPPWPRRPRPTSFNPLHCGAVVASRRRARAAPGRRRVSIPFIAGQWSLHFLFGPFCAGDCFVSIPFIAGQWSLPYSAPRRVRRTARAFQSPSLRGSGRFWTTAHPAPAAQATCFNPLHCGAVVASVYDAGGAAAPAFWFQSPSLRGSGRFEAARARDAERRAGFNPLHCGAVVASGRRPRRLGAARRVSIPFIAGQWSLLAHLGGAAETTFTVSIPFIAGQWSLPPRACRSMRRS